MSTEATAPAAGDATRAIASQSESDTPAQNVTTSQEPAAEGSEIDGEAPTDNGEAKPSEDMAKRLLNQQHRGDRLKRQRDTLADQLRAAQREIDTLRAPPKTNIADLDYDQREEARLRNVVRSERADNIERHAKQLQTQVADLDEQRLEARTETTRGLVEKAADRFPGLWDKFTATDASGQHIIDVTDIGADLISESDVAVELIDHLTRNPKEARRIAQLPPLQQVRELTRIESKVVRSPRRPTNAPNPGTQLNGSTAGGGAKPFAQMSDDEASANYRARRDKKR